jgi:hypothetical protein
MGFVPVQFRKPDSTVGKPHLGDALQLPPRPATVRPPKAGQIPDRAARSNGLNFSNLSNDLELHVSDKLGFYGNANATTAPPTIPATYCLPFLP